MAMMNPTTLCLSLVVVAAAVAGETELPFAEDIQDCRGRVPAHDVTNLIQKELKVARACEKQDKDIDLDHLLGADSGGAPKLPTSNRIEIDPVLLEEKERHDVATHVHHEQPDPGAPSRMLPNGRPQLATPAVLFDLGRAVELLREKAVAMVQTSESSSWAIKLAAEGPWTSLDLASCVAWMTCLVLIAVFHRRAQKEKETIFREAPQIQKDWSLMTWRTTLWNPWSDTQVCLWSFLCPGIRWADTLSALDLLGFWPAFLSFTVLSMLGYLTAFWALKLVVAGLTAPQAVDLLRLVTLACCASCAAHGMLCVYFRRRIREKFDMERHTYQLIVDCMIFFCCLPCMISQEAHQVRAAMALGRKQAETVTWYYMQ